jgi:hypothetical protein
MKRSVPLRSRSGLKRTVPLKRTTGLSRGGSLTAPASARAGQGQTGKSGEPRDSGYVTRPSRGSLKRGRGMAASKAQREKVRGMACVGCERMAAEYLRIDPAHLCARGMGGCDEPECVVPLCRSLHGGCHRRFDAGELDLLPMLEPRFRAEVAHCVTHLGLEGTRVRLAPSCYRPKARDV